MFVRVLGHESTAWGIGKVEHQEDGLAHVSFFDSPVTESTRVSVPETCLRPVILAPQTRIYWQDEETVDWRVGRMIDADHEVAEVQFPNKDIRILKVDDIFVRWDKPIKDPTDYLRHKINETPRFAQARSGFTKALIAQRGACQGMTALISSTIDFEPHQVEVVRRVLRDPVQRYLLADEVGLGKTIEAGVLIRQYVLDEPTNHNVVILVPQALVSQWRDELDHRFLLKAQLEDSINIVSMAEPMDRLGSLVSNAGMLVIDEAHNLSSNHCLYEGLRESISSVPRLLLLSATPVLHNERGFLEMLHLLDPFVYRLEQEEAFRQRIKHRQLLAETVAGLVPENLLQLDLFLDDLTAKFDQDRLLNSHAETLQKILDEFPEENDQQFIQALNQLRSHVSETYRLDRRILRNRRNNLPGITPTRIGVTFIDYSSNFENSLSVAIEGWRSHVAAVIYGREDTYEGLDIASWYSKLLASALSEPSCLEELVRVRIEKLQLSPEGENESIEMQFLREILIAAQNLSQESNRCAALAEYLKEVGSSRTKIIVFCTEITVADAVAKYLKWNQSVPVDRYVNRHDMEEDATNLNGFLNGPDQRILVCDASAEEGLNLQGGDKIIVHFDLPLSPNRIEQRIGRVDRYGSGEPIRSLALRCINDPFEMAWASCLDKGMGVFNHSIASLQYLIENELNRLSRSLLIDGLEAITLLTNSLGEVDGLVSKELRRIKDQDSLDSLAVPLEESLDDLIDVDCDWRGFNEEVDRWLLEALMLGKVQGPEVGRIPDTVFRLNYRDPKKGHKTLIPKPTFLFHFMDALDVDAPGASSKNLVTFPYTCRRETALRRLSREHDVRLLRLGEPFLEGLMKFTANDDRGRSMAMWRHVPGYESDEKADVFIRFNFIIECNIDEALNCYTDSGQDATITARSALLRRGDMAFAPYFESVWLDGSLNLVDDNEWLDFNLRPYKSPKDFDRHDETEGRPRYIDSNLNYERWRNVAESGLPVMDYWSDWVASASEKAIQTIRKSHSLVDRCDKAVELAKIADASLFAQLQTRINRTAGKVAEDEERTLNLETSVANALYSGIQNPRLTIDTISAVFISGEALVPYVSN